MKTFATLFSGGGGADLGLMAAGLRPRWGVEYDEKIAGVYADNFGHAPIVADVRAVDYAALPAVDWLHASPVCTRASVANAGAVESSEDTETAAAVVRAVESAGPRVVTIENVWQYRNFAAFRLICDGLDRLGYLWTVDHVNAADLGVPQTRRRLILRAVWGGLLPPLPALVAWVGWYAAIEDLIPSLPDSQLAPWQLARLPGEYRTLLFGNHSHTASGARSYVPGDEPIFAVSAQYLGRAKAVLVPKTANKYGDFVRADSLPAQTIGANEHGSKAVLIDGNNTSGPGRGGGLVAAAAGDPAFTVPGARSAQHRAILASARVVAMTPRALARFQSFPDSYRLPNGRALAAKVIGNAVSPLMIQRIAADLLAALA